MAAKKASRMRDPADLTEAIYAVVRAIPRGKAVTYSQVADFRSR
jgi:alkylated DNA nucleotide flippase Atl1